MFLSFHRKFLCAVGVVALVLMMLMGCGDSQSVETLHKWLADFSQQVEQYKTEVSADKTKQAEWDAKIDGLTKKWIDLRGEYGEALTPQDMQKLVDEYENVMANLKEFKSSIGS
jgi:hypothetical protein